MGSEALDVILTVKVSRSMMNKLDARAPSAAKSNFVRAALARALGGKMRARRLGASKRRVNRYSLACHGHGARGVNQINARSQEHGQEEG